MIKDITERLGRRRGLATKQPGQIVPVGRKVAGTQQGRGRARQRAARSLLDQGSIDELQLMIFLVVIGEGERHSDESTYMASSWLT